VKAIRILIVSLLLGIPARTTATVQALLDHDHIAFGDSVTLTIASDAPGTQPELAPLRADFDLRGSSTSSQTNIVNGSMQSSMQWSIALVPRHNGTITIPALKVGSEHTQPLRLDVGAEASAPANVSAAKGGPVFIETAIDPTDAYVQQALVYTVRLYYAVTLLDGALDPPTADNGDLRQLGNDVTTSVMVQGRRYNMLERHYLLQPEHSGALHLSAPGFHGRAMGELDNMFDDNMPVSGGAVRAIGKPLDMQVRARPPHAGDPWLPARSVALAVEPPNRQLHAGEPFGITVKLSGEGMIAAQLPEIALPAIAGAQVYPEPSSTAERFRDGHLLAERTRHFAMVPERAGSLKMPELTMPWWDVVNDHAALARLALPALQVLPGAAVQGDSGTRASPDVGDTAAASATASATAASAIGLRAWQIAVFCLAVALALSLWWGWRRGQHSVVPVAQSVVAHAPNRAPSLMRALALGDPSAIAQALLESAPGATPRHLGELAQRLDDHAQREALLAFDAARWSSDGTPSVQALAQLREAFKHPPRWASRAPRESGEDALPPLYPS
jgi:hypothetical protein